MQNNLDDAISLNLFRLFLVPDWMVDRPLLVINNHLIKDFIIIRHVFKSDGHPAAETGHSLFSSREIFFQLSLQIMIFIKVYISMSLDQIVIKQAAMSAYRHSHGLTQDEHLPAISNKLRRPAQLAAGKLPLGLQSDRFSKTLDRAVNKQMAIEPRNHEYTVYEANTGVYRFLIDMSLTRQTVQEKFGIAERTVNSRNTSVTSVPNDSWRYKFISTSFD